MIDVDLPDGRSVSIDTDDPKVAASAAQKFLTQNPMALFDAADVAKSAGSGLVRGTANLVGTGGDISNLAAAGTKKLEESGVPVQDMRQKALDYLPAWLRKFHEPSRAVPDMGSTAIKKKIEETVGAPIASYEPQTRAGKVAGTVGEFAAPAMFGGGGLLRGAVAPGVLSSVVGQAAEGTGYETPAAIGGAILGGSIIPYKAQTPGVAALKAESRIGYNAPEVTSLELSPSGMAPLRQSIETAIEAGGARPGMQGMGPVYRGVAELGKAPNTLAGRAAGPAATVKIEDLKSVRTVLGKVQRDNTDKITGELTTAGDAARTAKEKITDYIANPPRIDVVAGDVDAASTILRAATGDWAHAKRMALVDALMRRAEINAGAANSGQNINNARRQQLKVLLKDRSKTAGMTPEQIEQLERAVMGTKTGNVARFLGNALAPSGAMALQNSAAAGGLGAGASYLFGGDPATAGAVSAVASQVLGRGARGIGNASQARQAAEFKRMVGQTAPMMQNAEALARQGINLTPRNLAIIQALMAGREPSRIESRQ